MSGESIQVRLVTADDWAQLQDIRLAMLADSPTAFRVSRARAERISEWGWRRRAGRSSHRAITVAAVENGVWIGTAGAYRTRRGVMLVAVYVDPQHRGKPKGVLDALLHAVETWAAERAELITLVVEQRNVRAQRAYESRGYRPTGRVFSRQSADASTEVEFSKSLG